MVCAASTNGPTVASGRIGNLFVFRKGGNCRRRGQPLPRTPTLAAAQPNTGGLLLKARRPVGRPAAEIKGSFSSFRLLILFLLLFLEGKRHRDAVGTASLRFPVWTWFQAFLRGRPRPRFGLSAFAMSFGSRAGTKSGYLAMLFSRMAMRLATAMSASFRALPFSMRRR